MWRKLSLRYLASSFLMKNDFLSKHISDEVYLRFIYKGFTDRSLNLEKPKLFNEKLQWMKLYNRKPEFTTMVDKYEAKKYVAQILSEQYVIPTIGVFSSPNEIPYGKLPNSFVIKCTHDSGSVYVCKNKFDFDIKKVNRNLRKALNKNWFWSGREWPYKDVKPRILIEEYISSENGSDQLEVYKFFCFNGKAVLVQTIQNDKKENETIDYYDVNWNLLNLKQNYPNSEKPLKKPRNLIKMIQLAELLSAGHPFLRVDLFSVENHIYFSEFTFFTDNGLIPFNPPEWDEKLGELIDISMI